MGQWRKGPTSSRLWPIRPAERSSICCSSSDGQTAGGLWARFPEMTRFGVSKHLRILEEANLITTARQGRTKLHFLNPVPIAQIAHRWISKYAAPYAGALVDLDQHILSSST